MHPKIWMVFPKGPHTLFLFLTQNLNLPRPPPSVLSSCTAREIFPKRTADSLSLPLRRYCPPVTAFQQPDPFTSDCPARPLSGIISQPRCAASEGWLGPVCHSAGKSSTHVRPPSSEAVRQSCFGRDDGYSVSYTVSFAAGRLALFLYPLWLFCVKPLARLRLGQIGGGWRVGCLPPADRLWPQRAANATKGPHSVSDHEEPRAVCALQRSFWAT